MALGLNSTFRVRIWLNSAVRTENWSNSAVKMYGSLNFAG